MAKPERVDIAPHGDVVFICTKEDKSMVRLRVSSVIGKALDSFRATSNNMFTPPIRTSKGCSYLWCKDNLTSHPPVSVSGYWEETIAKEQKEIWKTCSTCDQCGSIGKGMHCKHTELNTPFGK